MVAAGLFPASMPPFVDGSNSLIAEQRFSLCVAMWLNFGVLVRGNDRTHRRALVGRGQGVEALALIIGFIAAQRLEGSLRLLKQRLHLRGVTLARGRLGLRDDLAGVLVDAHVPFAPCAPLAKVVLTFVGRAFV